MPVRLGADGACDEEGHRGDEEAAEREDDDGGVREVLDEIDREQAADEGGAEADGKPPEDIALRRRWR